jgi:hypothetical protein
MKHFKKFNSSSEYEEWINSDELVVPHIAYILTEGIIKLPPRSVSDTDYNQIINGLIKNILKTDI